METSVKTFLVFGADAIMLTIKDSVNSTVGCKLNHNRMSWQGIGNSVIVPPITQTNKTGNSGTEMYPKNGYGCRWLTGGFPSEVRN